MNGDWKALIRPNGPPLAKVYVEPTSRCNLECTTCMRRSWEERPGDMSMDAFHALLRGLEPARAMKAMAFWGIGEPLLHPGISGMIRLARGRGYATELVTNAMLLSEKVSASLISAGLGLLVASVDGTSRSSYTGIREGADFDRLLKNLNGLNAQKARLGSRTPEIGLEFVASRKNISELPALMDLADALGARTVIVTNVVPYTRDFQDEILYWLATGSPRRPLAISSRGKRIILPNMDERPECLAALAGLPLKRNAWAGSGRGRPHCPFVEKGAMAVRWDGEASPCVALMHSHACFFLDRPKAVRRYGVGNVTAEPAVEVWNKPEYQKFRDRVLRFDFPPCSHCGCDLAQSNEEDCCGSPFPTCGDCLWAQGIAVCP